MFIFGKKKANIMEIPTKEVLSKLTKKADYLIRPVIVLNLIFIQMPETLNVKQ